MSIARASRPPGLFDEARAAQPAPRTIGRYLVGGPIGSGGCATVHLGRLIAEAGFSRLVAVKRLHAEYSADPEFVEMFLDEARLAARIHHPNVVQALDVFWSPPDGPSRELVLIMDYVEGETLSRLVAKSPSELEPPPVRIVVAVMAGVLRGLHAAHHAKSPSGADLEIIHRDVSPQNIIVGVDGVARLLDFGIAKAIGRAQTTRPGDFKGKAAYMAPEQIIGNATRLSDIYSASVVLWEALVGRPLFQGESQAAVLHKVVTGQVPLPSSLRSGISPAVEDVIMRGLARDENARFSSAQAMAEALEGGCVPAWPSEVGAWVRHVARQALEQRAAQVVLTSGPEATAVTETADAPAKVVWDLENSDLATRVERNPSGDNGGRAQGSGRLRRAAVALSLVAVVGPLALWLARGPARAGKRDAPMKPPASISAPLPVDPVGDARSTSESTRLPPATAPQNVPIPPTVSQGHRAKPLKPPARTTRPAPSASTACSPPYVIDSAGRMHFRTECL